MVPFLDLKAQYKTIAGELEPRVLQVLASGGYILGENVTAFEEEFARYLGIRHAVGVSSGLDALRLALLALGIGPGDEVITQANTFIATALAITSVGATPVLVDPDPETYNIDAEIVSRAITPRTRAIMPVHLYGLAVKMEPILRIARERGLKVIEDACQAHGALVGGHKAGTQGDISCFSFYPGKNLGAAGDAGAVVTESLDLAERTRRLRNYGQVRKYYHAELGFNHRLDEVQAAVLRVKLRHLDDWNGARRTHAHRYTEELSGLPIHLPLEPEGHTHVFHLYVIRTDHRDELQQFLTQRGVSTLIHYPIPIHRQEAYQGLSLPEGSLPVSERTARQILSLPMFPELSTPQIQTVIGAIREFFEKR